MKQFKFSILIIYLVSFVFAGTDGTIRGQVKDAEGSPLPGVQLFIPDLSMGAIADINGNSKPSSWLL